MRWSYQNLVYGANERHKFDVIIPKGKEVHAIVYIHGGAYLTGNKSQYPSFLEDYSKTNLFASIDYRLISADNNVQMENILSDIHGALLKIIQISGTHNVAIKDFILIGHSAGGHIGLLYGYKFFRKDEKIKITACVSLAGPTDFTDDLGWSSMSMWGKDIESRLLFLSQVGTRLTDHPIEITQYNWTKQKNYHTFKKHLMHISPIAYVFNQTGGIPPTLLVHAQSDNQVPYSNAVRLKTALEYASVPHKLITPSGNADNHMLGGYTCAEFEPILYGNLFWVYEVKKWMETYLGSVEKGSLI